MVTFRKMKEKKWTELLRIAPWAQIKVWCVSDTSDFFLLKKSYFFLEFFWWWSWKKHEKSLFFGHVFIFVTCQLRLKMGIVLKFVQTSDKSTFHVELLMLGKEISEKSHHMQIVRSIEQKLALRVYANRDLEKHRKIS